MKKIIFVLFLFVLFSCIESYLENKEFTVRVHLIDGSEQVEKYLLPENSTFEITSRGGSYFLVANIHNATNYHLYDKQLKPAVIDFKIDSIK